MTERDEQIANALGNLALMRGNVTGLLMKHGHELDCDGAFADSDVEPEIDNDGLTGATIITRSGVKYRVSVDLA